MSAKKENGVEDQPKEESAPVSMQSSGPRELDFSKSVMRVVHPLGMRVVVKIRPETDTTDSGLYLPEGSKVAKQESVVGEVLEVASAIDEDLEEEANISGIPEGSLVLIRKDAGVEIPWDETLRVVETKEVLAIIEEVDLS